MPRLSLSRQQKKAIIDDIINNKEAWYFRMRLLEMFMQNPDQYEKLRNWEKEFE